MISVKKYFCESCTHFKVFGCWIKNQNLLKMENLFAAAWLYIKNTFFERSNYLKTLSKQPSNLLLIQKKLNALSDCLCLFDRVEQAKNLFLFREKTRETISVLVFTCIQMRFFRTG